MKKINPDDFRVRAGKKVDLNKWPTSMKPVYDSKEEYARLHAEHIEKLSAQQSVLYASNRYALLLIFQAWTRLGRTAPLSM